MTTTKQAGRLGGTARAARLTKAELSAIGKKGAAVRWAKRRRYVTAQPRQKGGTR